MKSFQKNESQISKKGNSKTETSYINHDKDKINYLLIKENSDNKSENKIIDLNDFPALNCDSKTTVNRRQQQIGNSSEINCRKSWISVVNTNIKNNGENENIKQTNNINLLQIKEDNNEKNNEVMSKKKNKKKASSSKKVIVKPANNPYKKKRSAPISVNLIEVINVCIISINVFTINKSCSTLHDLLYFIMFRYCENLITPSLDLAVAELIKDLIRLQDRAFIHDPIKAKAKKRHISGLREVKKYFTLNKIKMLIIPPNLEKLQMEGSIFDTINELKALAKSQNVPCVFALNRYKLGRCTKKNVSDRFQSVLKELEDAKKLFVEKVQKEDNINKQNEMEKINLPLKTTLKEALVENLHKKK
ncbi:conserved hypothetical protein [Pediculus humanus corporis]|uniref:Ribosomal protein eL8/eL30/eS12/Gadd45 domain-containing protein n=1 Tax=Pediculus humanus subsp. corporis TaxID=121224 RepID=E0VUQ0_PEDHC|nr:uncharacterized protein Phum_PHUM452870 [Pediculus humanus corporis]EEB17106.1 conserved hypothetical protein [Pediculus humanus corporis]